MKACIGVSVLTGAYLRLYHRIASTNFSLVIQGCTSFLIVAVCLSIFSSAMPVHADMFFIGHSSLIPKGSFEEGPDGHLYAYLPFGKYVYLSDEDRWEFKEWVNFQEHLHKESHEKYNGPGKFIHEGKEYGLDLVTDGKWHSPEIKAVKIDVSSVGPDKESDTAQRTFSLDVGSKLQCSSRPLIFTNSFDGRFLWFDIDCPSGDAEYPIGAGYFDEQLGEINLIELQPRLPEDRHFYISSVAPSKHETWITGSGYRGEDGVGLILFDHETRTFSQFIKSGYGLIDNETLDVRIYKDNVWIVTAKGFNKFEPSSGKWTRYLPSKLKAKSELDIRCEGSFSLATVEKGTLLDQTGWVSSFGGLDHSALVVGLPEPFIGSLRESDREQVVAQWGQHSQWLPKGSVYAMGLALAPQTVQKDHCWLEIFGAVKVVSDPHDASLPIKVELNEGIIHPKEVDVEFVRE